MKLTIRRDLVAGFKRQDDVLQLAMAEAEGPTKHTLQRALHVLREHCKAFLVAIDEELVGKCGSTPAKIGDRVIEGQDALLERGVTYPLVGLVDDLNPAVGGNFSEEICAETLALLVTLLGDRWPWMSVIHERRLAHPASNFPVMLPARR